jgi:Ca-activated chloride channel family protein
VNASAFHFAHPWVLLLLLGLPPLAWWWLRQRRAALRFSDVSFAGQIRGGRTRLVRWSGLVARGIGLALLILALAGPRWPDEGSRIPTEGISICIVLDASQSMTKQDADWDGKSVTRFEAVRKVFQLFVAGGTAPGGLEFSGRGNDLVALVVFGTRPETVCPLTLNHGVLLEILHKEEPRTVPGTNRTNIGDGIVWGLNALNATGKGKKVLVLLTDGEHNVEPPALKPRQAAQLAGNLEVPIYVIDAGKDSLGLGENEDGSEVNRDRARKILQEVAGISHAGKYFAAGDTKTLLEVCNQIDTLEKTKIESPIYRRYHEGYVWFALTAFVFFFGIWMMELTWWRRVP